MHLFPTTNGKIYKRKPGSTTRTEVSLPSDVALSPFSTYTDWVLLPGMDRLILCGRWNAPLVWIPSLQRLWRAGIEAPDTAPGLAAGMGTGLTGEMIGVYTFAEQTADQIVHESNPSPASGTASLTNQDRAWTSLPTSHPNPRVTHKRLYVSVDGDSYLFVASVPLADATYTEAVATNELGDEVSERRGVPPKDSIYVTSYHRRAWYTNGTDTFWYSELDEPESVAAGNELKTEDARNITALRGMTDQLIIGTRRSFQDLQGWGGANGSDDFAQRIITQDIGIISNRGSKVINDKLWFPSQDGYSRYGSGGFQFLMKNLRTYFRTAYEADPTAYEGMQIAIDRRRHTANVLVPGSTTLYYVGHYLPCESELGGTGEPPYWVFDTRADGRVDTAIGELTEDALFDRLYTGSDDGFVRLEGTADADDDGVDIDFDLVFKHFFMGDQSGDDAHAHTFDSFDIFARSEDKAWTASAYVGDDDAASQSSANWTKPVAASALTKGEFRAISKTSHHFKVERAGKGITPRIQGTNLTDMQVRGLGIDFTNVGVQPPRGIAG